MTAMLTGAEQVTILTPSLVIVLNWKAGA